jgi:cytoskeletal protein CcmA (bactofilin family)
MALFNSKEPEKNVKPQPMTNAHVQPVQSPVAAPAAADPKLANGNSIGARSAAMPSSDSGAYLDAGSRINGKLSFETPARIDGQVEGEINAKDSLTIGESAVVSAQVRAASVIVAGKVSGDIIAAHRIEIRPSAKVMGNITAPTLVINEGALFEGHCTMQPEAHDDRKVTVFPKEERLAQAVGHKPA